MLVCAEILVSGRVQGVCFRAFTEEAARRLGLTGFCRNLLDGRVEAYAEGDRAVIEAFIEQLRAGPPGSRVENLSVVWKSAQRDFSDFMIHYD